MTFSEIVKTMLKQSGMTQKELADRLGFASQGGVANVLRKDDMLVSMVLKVLDQFGYTLAIVKKDDVNLTFLEMTEKKTED